MMVLVFNVASYIVLSCNNEISLFFPDNIGTWKLFGSRLQLRAWL